MWMMFTSSCERWRMWWRSSIFAIFLSYFFLTSSRPALRRWWFAFALLGLFLFACSDEYHQTFVADRVGQFRDVELDTAAGRRYPTDHRRRPPPAPPPCRLTWLHSPLVPGPSPLPRVLHLRRHRRRRQINATETLLRLARGARQKQVLACRDPGSTAIGEAVRNLLLNRTDLAIHRRSEMLLYMAARAQLVEEVIRPGAGRGENGRVGSVSAFQCGLPRICGWIGCR